MAARESDWALADGHLKEILKLVADPEELVAAAAARVVYSGIDIRPCEYFMARQSGLETKAKNSNEARRRDEAVGIWQAIVSQAVRTAIDEDVLLTPMLNQVLKRATGVRNRFEWDNKVEGIPLGPGLDERIEKIEQWLERASATDVRAIDNKETKYLGASVARRSHLLSSPETIFDVLPLIVDNLAEALQNPFLTRASRDVLAEVALSQISELRNISLTTGPGRDLPAFWLKYAKIGGQLDKSQIRRLRVLTELGRMGEGTAVVAKAGIIATIREAGSNKEIRAILLEQAYAQYGGYSEIVRLLYSSRGREWVSLLKEVLVLGASFKELKGPLEYTDEWHLEGVRRADLLFLVESKDEGVRNTGQRLMGMVKNEIVGTSERKRQRPGGRQR
jgi:hypothetical protein